MTNEDVFVVLGEPSNVKRCIAELTDMANETEATLPLSAVQIRALLAHDHSYRRSIENSCRVFMSLKEAEVTIRGGQNAVRNAERALNDLMKSTEVAGPLTLRAVQLPPYALPAQRADQSKDGKVPCVAEGMPGVLGVHPRVRRPADSGNRAGPARVLGRHGAAM